MISTVSAALADPRFLRTSWPWRAAVHVLGTLAVAGTALLPLGVLGLPWLAAVVLLRTHGGLTGGAVGPVLALAVLGCVAVVVGLPLVALPLGQVERARLRIVDARPIRGGHQPAPLGLSAWVRIRYRDAATWREVAYAVLIVTVCTAVGLASGVLALTAAVLVGSPLVAAAAGGIALGFTTVHGTAEALPYAAVGLVLLPVTAYAIGLAAAVQAALARALLDGSGGLELTEVARSRSRLVDAFEAERRRIERDLHDGAQERLVGLTLQLGMAKLDLPADSPAQASVTAAHGQAKELMQELRELVRGIHPRVLTDRGLPAAIGELADRCPTPVTVDAPLIARLPAHVESTAWFVVAEALTNVAKHAEATRATVRAHLLGAVLVVEVEDDGRGGADPERGSGLTGIADRIAVLEGRLLLASPDGGPTLLRVELPCGSVPA